MLNFVLLCTLERFHYWKKKVLKKGKRIIES